MHPIIAYILGFWTPFALAYITIVIDRGRTNRSIARSRRLQEQLDQYHV